MYVIIFVICYISLVLSESSQPDDLDDLAHAIMTEISKLSYQVSEADVTRACNQVYFIFIRSFTKDFWFFKHTSNHFFAWIMTSWVATIDDYWRLFIFSLNLPSNFILMVPALLLRMLVVRYVFSPFTICIVCSFLLQHPNFFCMHSCSHMDVEYPLQNCLQGLMQLMSAPLSELQTVSYLIRLVLLFQNIPWCIQVHNLRLHCNLNLQDIAIAAMGPIKTLPDYNWFRRRTFMLRY